MKKSWRILFTVLWLILAAASCRAVFQESDWPVQYYDLNHTGYSTAYSRDHIENLSLLYLFDAGSDVSSPVAADINGDNKTEILLGSQNKTLYALDPEANVLWTYETNGSVTTPGIYDIYGDGKYEILFGSGDGRIYLIDSGGKEIWNLSTNGSIKQSPVAVNLDAWPQKEIVAASSDENLYVIDYQGKIMKSYSLFDDPTTIPSFGDFDKDNKTDIFVGSVNDRVDVIGFPGLMRWSYNAQGAVNGVIAYDYNRDGKTDVVITSADGNIYSLSYTQHGSAESVKKCDNDGTCKDEPLTVSTLGKDWAYKTGGEIVSPPVLADIDGDYAKEIIAGSRDKTLYILNTTGQVKQTYTVNGRILASPAVADLDGDGKAEIAFGSDDGSLYVINSTGYAEWGYKTKDPIDQSPILADINNDGNLEILAASGSKLYIFGTKPEEKPPEPTKVENF